MGGGAAEAVLAPDTGHRRIGDSRRPRRLLACAGCDSPYFVVFECAPGSSGSEAELVIVRRESWDNEIASGSDRTPEHVVAKEIDTNHVVLCALMEEDNDRDIAGEA